MALNTIMEDDLIEGQEQELERSGRRRSRSTSERPSSASCSPVPSLTSTISSYYQSKRLSQDYDDLYDVSDSESEDQDRTPGLNDRPMSMYSDDSRRSSWSVASRKNRYPSLVIPSPRNWPTHQTFNKSSPVPPTPPAKIAISPAVLSLFIPQAPAASATPSLDGSLTSDQLAASTAPPTPDMQTSALGANAWTQIEVAVSGSDFQEHIRDETHVPVIEVQLEDGDMWHQENHTFDESEFAPVVGRPESPLLGTSGTGNSPNDDEEEIEMGVQLPEGALDTLRHLSLEVVSELASAIDQHEMQEIDAGAFMGRERRRSWDQTPASEVSEYSFSALSVPSPGGFFSSLGANARHTWYAAGFGNECPPSSTTAEHFYNAPWNVKSDIIVQQVVEIDDDGTEGPPTAKQMPFPSPQTVRPSTTRTNTETTITSLITTVEEIPRKVQAHDEDYEKEIWHSAETTFDRTSSWLAEQTSYMAALREANPVNQQTEDEELVSRKTSKHSTEASLGSPFKKTVKFLDIEITKITRSRSDSEAKADPLFYQAFQHMSNTSSPTDSFIHRQTRYDAIQASRTCSPQEHVDQLLGYYHTTNTNRPHQQRPISMMPGKGDFVEETAEQRVISRVERERQALEQVTPAMWIVEAIRYLNGGRIVNGPVADVLSNAPSTSNNNVEHVRVLDLGGQPKCDWAWHCAREYPNVKTYTATNDNRAQGTPIRGPSNHRLVSVENLWELPFPDNHFDAISARSLFTFLKNEKPLGETIDEYDMCLKECLRCLKPGGYLEWFVLDSEIVHAGPRGTAVSVEFGFNLKARGYDPAPSKSWLGRIRRAGLVDIKRAWMFMPMGAVNQNSHVPPETPPPHVSMYEDRILAAEAVQGPVGSKADAAMISGLVGSWAWEQWMLKLQMEMGKENLLEGVGAVLEEGKSTGAGWRCLSGWARKPL